MFDNLQRSCLWDMLSDNLKVLDSTTTKRGVLRKPDDSGYFIDDSQLEKKGQTERYMLVIGEVVKDFFNDIERLHKWGGIDGDAYSLLPILQRRSEVECIKLSEDTERLVRHVLEEAPHAWRLKGTKAFLHWIIWKVFNWQLKDYATFASKVFKASVSTDVTFSPELDVNSLRLYYDPIQLEPMDRTVLSVDVFFDSDFEEKKALLEDLLKKWAYPCTMRYLNTL